MDTMNTENRPPWLRDNGTIQEARFARDYLLQHPMICVNGTFYTTEGAMTDESALRREIYRLIAEYVGTSVSKRVNALVEVLRLESRKDSVPINENVIHVSNGTFSLREGFTTAKYICRNRLPVRYDLNLPEPEQWLRFLEDLLEPEDIETLQEYMGYCLIPATRAQKMLTIVGSGGEGKSRVGVVMKAILGRSMATGSLAKVEMSPYARADLENLLLFTDDDLQMEGFTQTNHLKSIITADTPMDLERKFVQSYQAQLHVRFLAFGNSALHALHDKSHGFFRRQLILRAKPRDCCRVDDPFLGNKLIRERDSIFLWALEGLYRLQARNYRFSESPRARQNLEELVHDSNHLIPFLGSNQYVLFEYGASATSRQIYETYRKWCADNTVTPLESKAFLQQLSDNALALNLTYSHSIPGEGGRCARGYRGIRLLC